MSLERFKTAQDSSGAGFATALAELRGGRKTSHWIWYIFPQLEGLGRSSTARAYALRNLDEAVVYLSDPLLRARLLQVTEIVAEQLSRGVRLVELMGGTIDALKLVSSLTLFELAVGEIGGAECEAELRRFAECCAAVLAAGERQGYPRCGYTLEHARS